MRYKLIIILLLLAVVVTGVSSAENSESQWQIFVEQNSGTIPRLKDLSGGLTRATNSISELGLSLKASLAYPEEAKKGPLAYLSDYAFLFNYGKTDLGFDFEYSGSATRFRVPNNTYLGFGISILFDLPQPWKFDVLLRSNFGTIIDQNIDYSSYQAGGTNFARKIKGTWKAVESVLGGIYSTEKLDYLFGLEGLSNSLSLTYFDYPSTPGTESSGSVYYNNSNVYVGLKYKFLGHGFLQVKYFLPVNDWLQGYIVKTGYEF